MAATHRQLWWKSPRREVLDEKEAGARSSRRFWPIISVTAVFSKLLRFYFRLLKSCWLTPLSSLSITELLFPSHVVFLVVWLFPFHHFSHFSFSECGASLGCYHPSRCRSSSSSHFLSRLLTFIFPLIFLFLCLHLLKCFHLSVIYFPFSLSFFLPPWKLPVYTQKLFDGMY